MSFATKKQNVPFFALAALGWAAWRAYALRWVTDDAFLSFRCAANLVDGHGLVFNVGERVEVFTNPLWTLWAAAGLALGVAAETWCNVWSVACYLGTIALLAANNHDLARAGHGAIRWVPLAAIGAALHQEWNVFATSGLETSAFTFLLVSGFLLVVRSRSRLPWLAAAGAVFALAALTRHDGAAPALVTGLFVLGTSRERWKAAAVFGLSFAAIWLPPTAWRVAYYGELFPNSYYAKSAYLSWYGQGLRYLWLYVEKYWLLFTGPLLLGIASRSSQAWRREEFRQAVLAGAIAVTYIFYVVKVGGDFMFGRFLIPATPFLLILLELGWARLFASRPAAGWIVAAAGLGAMMLMPAPVSGSDFRWGVANERTYYNSTKVTQLDHSAEVLGRYFEGLDVRVAFYGDEARIVYKARFPVAIESSAGLTEPEVARAELAERGRPGHEKYPSAEYLIRRRKAHFTFSRVPRQLIDIDRRIPRVYVKFDAEVFGQALHWDPELMAALARRGAQVTDFPGDLDRLIARLDRLPRRQVAEAYERSRLFYFEHVDDPEREVAFRRRLEKELP